MTISVQINYYIIFPSPSSSHMYQPLAKNLKSRFLFRPCYQNINSNASDLIYFLDSFHPKIINSPLTLQGPTYRIAKDSIEYFLVTESPICSVHIINLLVTQFRGRLMIRKPYIPNGAVLPKVSRASAANWSVYNSNSSKQAGA